MSVVLIFLAGFSITITKKINNFIECKFKMSGDDLVKIIVIVTSCLAGITDVCGDRNSYYESREPHVEIGSTRPEVRIL